jgi:nucleoside-diphosphate-sugar epimerase
MMAVLITGGSGFIGSHLAKKLIEQGYEVIIFDMIPPKLLEEVKNKIIYVKGDVSSWNNIVNVLKNYQPNYIYHTAAILGDVAYENPMLAFKVNIEGTMNILEACRIFDIKNIIFISSIAIFAPSDKISDSSLKYPTEPYGISKLFGEAMGLYYTTRYDLDVRGLRGTWIFGPGRSRGGTAFSSLLIQLPALGQPVEVPDLMGNWCYVKDFVDALIVLARSKNPKQRFYIVGGENMKVSEVAKIVKEFIPEAKITIKPPSGVATLWSQIVDDSNFRKDFNWKPNYTIRDAIKDFINEVRNKSYIYDIS